MSSEQQKRRRLNLWNRNPHCHWCKVLTVLPPLVEIKGRVTPPNEATLDHVISRHVRQKGQLFSKGDNTVLACHHCNDRRAHEEETNLPIEVRWMKAHGWTPPPLPEIQPENLFLELTSVEDLLSMSSL